MNGDHAAAIQTMMLGTMAGVLLAENEKGRTKKIVEISAIALEAADHFDAQLATREGLAKLDEAKARLADKPDYSDARPPAATPATTPTPTPTP